MFSIFFGVGGKTDDLRRYPVDLMLFKTGISSTVLFFTFLIENLIYKQENNKIYADRSLRIKLNSFNKFL
jgi:hypothetical protein